MGIQVKLGTTGYVAVQDKSGKELWRKEVGSKKEATEWMEAHSHSVKGWGILKASFFPMRVDSCKDLAKDLLVPTFINHALRVNNLFLRIIASIGAFAWDIVTMPFRFVFLPFRIAQHRCGPTPESKVPVVQLIKESPDFKRVMDEGIVHLVAKIESTVGTKKFAYTPSKDKEEEVRLMDNLESIVGTRRFDHNLKLLKDSDCERRTDSYEASYDVVLRLMPGVWEKKQSREGTKFYSRNLPNEMWVPQMQSSGGLQETSLAF